MNVTVTGALVKLTFEVWESSNEIAPAIKTGNGMIVCTLA
jgi:hypothetical protein